MDVRRELAGHVEAGTAAMAEFCDQLCVGRQMKMEQDHGDGRGQLNRRVACNRVDGDRSVHGASHDEDVFTLPPPLGVQ